MKTEVNILLVYRKGGDFTMEDVLLISNQLQRKKAGLNVRVYCVTDAVHNSVELHSVTLLPMKYRWPGWWSKMNLFMPELEPLRPFLYLDLDTAIVQPISSILPHDQYQGGVIMLRDFYRPNRPASGVMWIPANNEKVNQVWSHWIKDCPGHIKRFRGDQQFIRSVITPDYYFQDIVTGVVSYKANPQKRIKHINGKQNLICFHGKPRIREAARGAGWVNDYIKGKV